MHSQGYAVNASAGSWLAKTDKVSGLDVPLPPEDVRHQQETRDYDGHHQNASLVEHNVG